MGDESTAAPVYSPFTLSGFDAHRAEYSKQLDLLTLFGHLDPEWRQPLRVWKGYFDKWIGSPTPMSVMLSSIFFDLRPVTGAVELFTPLQQTILKKSQENRIFLAYMMANALKHRPPLGFFRQFVLHPVLAGKLHCHRDRQHHGPGGGQRP